MCSSKIYGVALAILVSVAVSTSSASIITIMDADHANGWFTAPDVPGWAEPQAPTGWSVAGTTTTLGVTTNDFARQGIADGGVDAGGQYVYWNNPSSVNLNDWLWRTGLYTIDAANEQFTMSYYLGSNTALPGNCWINSWLDLTGGTSTAVHASNGYVLAKGITLGGTSSLQTLTYTTTAADIGKSVGVSFVFTSANGSAQVHLDNVTVTMTTVPEPSVVALLAFGLIGLLPYVWKKRK